ncbi:MAG: hypothetical protein K6U14_02375 [Firmicutes bacterium]|nr:hypothetical protein [Alicyclobacillaceae bacterium]MCL6496467.1 hypothetical protein [Bacillota bacterium]
MDDRERIQHLQPPPGVRMPRYPARWDLVYRWSLVAFVVGLTACAVATAVEAPAVHWWQGWSAVAMAVAGWTFLVWVPTWRWLVRGLVTIGAVLWWWWPLGGWAATLAASAIVAGKEYHCFRFWSGRYIPWVSLINGLGLVFGIPTHIQAVLWVAVAWLWVPLLVARWQLPLFELS